MKLYRLFPLSLVLLYFPVWANPSWNPPEITRRTFCEVLFTTDEIIQLKPGDYLSVPFGSSENRKMHIKKISGRIAIPGESAKVQPAMAVNGFHYGELISCLQVQAFGRYLCLFRLSRAGKRDLTFQVSDIAQDASVSHDRFRVEVDEASPQAHAGSLLPESLDEGLRPFSIQTAHEIHHRPETTPVPVQVHLGDLVVLKYTFPKKESYHLHPIDIQHDEGIGRGNTLEEVRTVTASIPEGFEISTYLRARHSGHVTLEKKATSPWDAEDIVWQVRQPIEVLP